MSNFFANYQDIDQSFLIKGQNNQNLDHEKANNNSFFQANFKENLAHSPFNLIENSGNNNKETENPGKNNNVIFKHNEYDNVDSHEKSKFKQTYSEKIKKLIDQKNKSLYECILFLFHNFAFEYIFRVFFFSKFF